MTLVSVGTDYRAVPTHTLEFLERHGDEILTTLNSDESPLSGVVVVATCNRFEIYADTEKFHDSVGFIHAVLRDALETSDDTVRDSFTVRHGTDLIEHAFGMTAGLHSLIVGEGEIAGQVKRALHHSHSRGAATTELHALFQTASSIAKSILATGAVGESGRSIATVAINHAEEIRRGKPLRTAVIVGTGAFARVIYSSLIRRGISVLGVFSQSGNVATFATRDSIPMLTESEFISTTAIADAVLSASGNEGFVVTPEHIHRVFEHRINLDPLVVIDVALARDVDPAIREFNHVTLIDLDTVATVVPDTAASVMEDARRLVADAVNEFVARRRGRAAVPVVTSIRQLVATHVEREVSLVRSRSGEDVADAVERSLRRVTNALLHGPTVRARNLASTGRDDEYRKAIHLLFGVEATSDD